MSGLSIIEIGNRITKAGNLETRPICVYGSKEPPVNAIPIASISRCIAKAILTIAVQKETPPLYIGEDTLEGCCPGGQA